MSKFKEYNDEAEKDEKQRRPFGAETQCRNCMFWSLDRKEEKALRDPDPDLFDIWGECRRHAPTPLDGVLAKIGDLLGSVAWAVEAAANIEHSKVTPYDFNGDNGDLGHQEVWFWPRTQSESWCGEFKAGRQPMSEEAIDRIEKLHDEWMAEPSILDKQGDKDDVETQTVDD